METGSYYANARSEMLKYIPAEAKTTLEFGCGQGVFSGQIKTQRNAETWGIEINPGAAERASQTLDKVIAGDAAEALPDLPERYFDCAVFNDVLEHLIDPFSLLDALKTKLTDKGVVVASIPNVRFWDNLRDLAWDGNWEYTDSGSLDRTHLRFFTYKSIRNMFERLDYEVITLEGLRSRHKTRIRILNALTFNRLWDTQYHQFACVAKPRR